MATANLLEAKTPSELALAWARFLLDDIIERREAKTQPLAPLAFLFMMDGEEVVFPTMPLHLESEPNPETLRAAVSSVENLLGYLVVLPGMPQRRTSWEAGEYTGTSSFPIGIPDDLIADGPFSMYLTALFTTQEISMVFCGGFDGEAFDTVRCAYGSFGGTLANMLGTYE